MALAIDEGAIEDHGEFIIAVAMFEIEGALDEDGIVDETNAGQYDIPEDVVETGRVGGYGPCSSPDRPGATAGKHVWHNHRDWRARSIAASRRAWPESKTVSAIRLNRGFSLPLEG